MPLLAFQLDDQHFTRIRTDMVERPDGRVSHYGVWLSVCRQCGKDFTQASARIPREPSRNTKRRCWPCISGATEAQISETDQKPDLQPIPAGWTRQGPDTSDVPPASWTPPAHDFRKTDPRSHEPTEPRPPIFSESPTPPPPPRTPRKPAKGGFSER